MSGTTYQASSALGQVVEAVINLMNATHPFATVTRGALPTGPGITCETDPSRPETLFWDKNVYIQLVIVINGKHHDMGVLNDALNSIHYELTRARSYPSGNGWQIVDIRNYTMPRFIGREDNNDWLMASALSVNFYWRG